MLNATILFLCMAVEVGVKMECYRIPTGTLFYSQGFSQAMTEGPILFKIHFPKVFLQECQENPQE